MSTNIDAPGKDIKEYRRRKPQNSRIISLKKSGMLQIILLIMIKNKRLINSRYGFYKRRRQA